MDVDQFNTLRSAAHKSNPSGVWSGAPSLAATTVPMTNTSGYPVTVGISGGTVTAIVVNGVTLTGTTSGRIRLGDGDTIAITYSSAPTLQWIYDN